VIEKSQMALSQLRAADRAPVVTPDPIADFGASVDDALVRSQDNIRLVVGLTKDNPVQHERCAEVAKLISDRSASCARQWPIAAKANSPTPGPKSPAVRAAK
jgi:hypothetical protein